MCRDLGRTEAQLHRQSPRVRSVLSRLSLQAWASSKTGDRFELQPIPRQLPVGCPFWGIACLCDTYTSKVGTFEATCALDYEEQETEAGLSMARSLLELSNGRRSALVPCLRQMKSSGGSNSTGTYYQHQLLSRPAHQVGSMLRIAQFRTTAKFRSEQCRET